MNAIRLAGIELASDASLFQCVNVALDVSLANEEEVEVLADGIKVGGFTRGVRTYPPKHEPLPLPTVNLDLLEAMAIEQAMEVTGGDRTKAAALLGIGRTTIWRRLKLARERYNLTVMKRAA